MTIYRMDGYRNKIPMLEFPIRLDVGAGAYPKEGFIRIDADPCNGETHICWDMKGGLPLPDRSCSEVYSSHCLEHFSRTDAHYILMEIFRVCADGARVEIRLPHASLPQGKLPCHYSFFDEGDMEAIGIWFPREQGTYWDLQSVTRDGIHVIGVFKIVKP